MNDLYVDFWRPELDTIVDAKGKSFNGGRAFLARAYVVETTGTDASMQVSTKKRHLPT
ncbi:hypothetical protein [Chryseomicrobium excrementi]|uniref:hypothetical protein n=1 Tax=Chryseomicrobium excrementi TaxID=2041346 RepID=UPI0013FD2140|nr:hypothetical protein [Chryseomicrobium excrementi]